MPRGLLLLLLLLPLFSACLFNQSKALEESMLYSPLEDYMGLEEGVVWRYSFYGEGETVQDFLHIAVISEEEREGTTLFKIREEWGHLHEEPLHGYYWSYDHQLDSYYEIGRFNHEEELFYSEEDYLFILHQHLSKGDRVFENYTHGDTFTVQGKERVEVKAGTFEAYVVKSYWGEKETGPWEEDVIYFVPHIGVVKRELVRGYRIEGVVQEEFPYVMELLEYSRDE